MSENLSELLIKWAKGDRQTYYDIYRLLEHYLLVNWGKLPLVGLDDFSEKKIDRFNVALRAYLQGKPLAYLSNYVEFYELELYIEEGVLIPRVDTEFMVKKIISQLSVGEKLLELGTGSGAISCAIAKNIPIQIVAIDKSVNAFEVAKKNVEKLALGEKIEVIQTSWCDYNGSGFDWVVANPPYIDINDESVDENVRRYEPLDALFAKKSGYEDLFYIIENAKKWLNSGGFLAIEHGFMQQEILIKKLKSSGYSNIFLGRDDKHPRYLIASY
jgi:release factor glutamine methyltransferase